jgi:hypothetical protein
VVGVVDPVQFVALGLGAADQPRAADLRAEVLADVEIAVAGMPSSSRKPLPAPPR